MGFRLLNLQIRLIWGKYGYTHIIWVFIENAHKTHIHIMHVICVCWTYLGCFYCFQRIKKSTSRQRSNLYISFAITAAGVVPCGGPKKSPRTLSIVQIIFLFRSFEISKDI